MNGTDVRILNDALLLRYLEADFYERGVGAHIFNARERGLLEVIRDHERAHIGALTSTIQQLGGTFTDRAMFLTIASTFEELGVAADHCRVTHLTNPGLLAAASAGSRRGIRFPQRTGRGLPRLLVRRD